MNTEQGVLIIAVGNPYYGNLAYQLAVSIKAFQSDVSVAVVHTSSTDAEKCSLGRLAQRQVAIFDALIECPPAYYTLDGRLEWQQAKLWADALTPFRHTMVIDADSLMFGKLKIADLFATLKGNPVVIQHDAVHNLDGNWGCLWNSDEGGLPAIRKAYNLSGGLITETQSSFMYFESNSVAAEFFATARAVYSERRVGFRLWNAGMPDELAFNIATAIHQLHAPEHLRPFTPLYFWNFKTRMPGRYFEDRPKDYYFGMSMAGNLIQDMNVLNLYNKTMAVANRYLNMPYLQQYRNKKDVISTRHHH